MRRFSARLLACAGLIAALPAAAFTPDVSQLQNLPLHMVHAPLAKAIEEAQSKSTPYRFAVRAEMPLELTDGVWDEVDPATARWRLRVSSPGAQSLNLEFARFHLPQGASLWIYDADGKLVQGPYTAANHTPEGKLWTAVVLGEQLVVELQVPRPERDQVELALGAVNHGFRGFGKVADPEGASNAGLGKSGACNVDTICPLGDNWRSQIRAVARYSLNGGVLCSGQLVNNQKQNLDPLFLTANHCGINASGGPASSMVVYWRFENSTCNGGDDANPTFTQSGATLLANDSKSDFALVRLNQAPSAHYNVYYAGWNASHTDAPQSGAVFHHPSGDAKKLATYDSSSPTTPVKRNDFSFEIFSNVSVWEVSYSHGTTEAGSSGSALFDQDQRVIGTLSAGAASCDDITGTDDYGRFEVAWDAKSATNQQLKAWLDPDGTNTTLSLAGRQPTGGTNTLPVANADTFRVANTGQTVLNVLQNDSDADGDALTITGVSASAHGTAVINADRSRISYAPTPGYLGSDTFTYSVWDGLGGTSSATVFVNVNRNPVANDDQFSVAQNSGESALNVLGNDVDPDNDPLTITSLGSTNHGGKIAIRNNGADVGYTPATGYTGPETFTYTITDPFGGTAIASVAVTINPSNTPPPSSGGGGGAMSPLALLAALIGSMVRRRHAPHR